MDLAFWLLGDIHFRIDLQLWRNRLSGHCSVLLLKLIEHISTCFLWSVFLLDWRGKHVGNSRLKLMLRGTRDKSALRCGHMFYSKIRLGSDLPAIFGILAGALDRLVF